MHPLTNQEIYKILNKENERNDAFRNANPQFKLDNSNIASDTAQIEYFENLYSNMDCGTYEFDEKDFNFRRVDRYTFQDIFKDNWIPFSNEHISNIRNVVMTEVEKMIHCQDPSLGYATYECPEYHESFCVPFTCKSRFCNTCGIKYQMDRASEISTNLIRCTHRLFSLQKVVLLILKTVLKVIYGLTILILIIPIFVKAFVVFYSNL